MYDTQHCFICRPSDSTVSEDAGIEPRTVATTALAVRRDNHSARSHPHSARSHPHSVRSHPQSARSHPHSLDLIHNSARSHPQTRLDLIHTRLDIILPLLPLVRWPPLLLLRWSADLSSGGHRFGPEFSRQNRPIKGTVSRDFRLLVFFINQFPPSPWVYHYGRFEIFRKFAEIFAAQDLPPVSLTPVANAKNFQSSKF